MEIHGWHRGICTFANLHIFALILELFHLRIIQQVPYKRSVVLFGAAGIPGGVKSSMVAALRASFEVQMIMFHQGFILFKDLVAVSAGDLVRMNTIDVVDPVFDSCKGK